jgi:methylenetetrahydrofolate dehydrogenase (NADP+)/methenyltetrahydrofolate cyclohydrolase
MTSTLINGRGIADAVLKNVGEQVQALGVPLHLAAVCAGNDPGLTAFVKLKEKAAQSAGITFSSYFFDADKEDELIQTLQYLANDESVDGILVELPLPDGWNRDKILALIPSAKDVDALTGRSPVIEPAVVALQYVFNEHDIAPYGATVAVIGQGQLVGAPIARWLTSEGANVRIIDEHTSGAADIACQADLVIAGVGKPGLVTSGWIKEGAVVIDYGYGKNTAGEYVGDVDSESVMQQASLLAPVPGGMGPLVIAAVLENLVKLATHS